MKKFISVAVSLMLAVMLCSCGLESDLTNSDTSYSSDISNNSSVSFEVGKVSGNKYTNKFLGIGCTLDSQWVFRTDEQIKEVNNIAFDMLDDDMKEQLENATIVYDMMAMAENGASININIENLGAVGAFKSVESYISPQMDSLKAALEQVGLTDVSIEIRTFDFAGKSEKGMYVHAMANGNVFEEAIIILKCGTRFANITIATTKEDLESILSYFYAV